MVFPAPLTTDTENVSVQRPETSQRIESNEFFEIIIAYISYPFQEDKLLFSLVFQFIFANLIMAQRLQRGNKDKL